MTSPQQPDTLGPIPEENQPGHHPPVEQDKPQRLPKLPVRGRRFRLRRSVTALASVPFGVVTPDTGYVEVDGERLSVRFGPWFVSTPASNVEGAQLTGPYRWWKVLGPPHLSIRDGGVTFATATDSGVCISFRDPVPGLLPIGAVRHPAVTITVEDPDGLLHLIEQIVDRQNDESLPS